VPHSFDLSEFNPLDPEMRRDPYAVYARGREFGVAGHPQLPTPIHSVFRYADVQQVLRDHETFSNEFGRSEAIEAELGQETPPSMLGSDPPRHTRLRSLVNSAFTPRIIQRLEPRMHEIAEQLVDDAVAKGDVDLVEALTYPLPVVMIAEIIGVPAKDRAQFKEWSDQVVKTLGVGIIDGGNVDRLERQQAVMNEMRNYFVPLAETRRIEPRDDLLTGLVQARHEGSKLDDEEMLAMLTLLLVAGNETTTTLIGNAAIALMEHPESADQLRSESELLPNAIEEVLRFSSPIQFDPRLVTRDIELCGTPLKEGQRLLNWIGSANRDEAVFPNPEIFDITRQKNPHLSFGFGTHYCLGANLARLEASVAIGTLLRKTKRFRRLNDDPLPLHTSPVFRSFSSIPVRIEGA